MRGSPRVVILLAVLVVVGGLGALAAAGTAIGQEDPEDPSAGGPEPDQQQQPPLVRGSPNLDVHSPDRVVTPGSTNEVEFQISNDGSLNVGTSDRREIVTTARNVRAEAEADSPLEVTTGQTAVGTITEDEPRPVTIAIDVPEGVEEGTYDVDVELKYAHTRQEAGGVTNDRSRTVTETFEVEVRDEARFEITDASTDTQIGDTGTLEAQIENTGSATAADVDVSLESLSDGLVIGETAEAGDSARIDELEAGETATVQYEAAIADGSPLRGYSVEGTVQFRDEDGIQRVDEGARGGFTPVDEQRFTIDEVESDLRVGEDGDVIGTVTNEGPVEARNVVVRYAEESPNVVPIEDAIAVGTLDAGESAEFRLPIEIGGEAEAIDRAADMAIEYRNADLERRAFEDVELLFEVEPKRDQFVVEMIDREIAAGDTKTVDVEVTNNLDETVEDVEARLFANDPLDSDDDEAFVEELDPGESTTMTFELEAESGATAKTYPISFDFRYDDERSRSQLSDTTRVAITVAEADGGIPWTLLIVGLVVVAAAGGGYYVYRDR
ncbi:COG1361 S-layer family protein [Halorubrum vacuolatum]|uniref:Uncharacterized conserved protein n=1 Tax=Halorubrum vacuolatum TaxID=63740 RepID=A0A238XB48_HALVU|nr:COG1361 S-layer family protein [Halorubrum vacuolatum]SNR56177.1 Uncharacterized conserved protein [Halorubrum vacuolatum]